MVFFYTFRGLRVSSNGKYGRVQSILQYVLFISLIDGLKILNIANNEVVAWLGQRRIGYKPSSIVEFHI